ncbi:MAG: pilus assembly protein [Chloroflexi bacterium]|nr:TadE/TadG family type IV pilus assembly protein [Chloroflexota bacterium]MQC25941.1 pilus assembly protein [Chloroflexota bacterium]
MNAEQRPSSFKRAKSRGQGMVEFALVLPMLLLIVYGLFEVGRMTYIYFSVVTASREAARYGVAVDESGSGTPQYIDCAAIRTAAKNFGSIAGIQDADISITYDRGPGGAALGSCPVAAESLLLGDRIIVQVTGYFAPGPAIPLFNFPSFTLSSTTRRTIVKEVSLE